MHGRSLTSSRFSLDRLEEHVVSLWKQEGRTVWQVKDPKAIAKKVRELVDLQAEVFQYSVGRADILNYIQTRPDLILNRIIKHILYIFDIPQVDGIVSKLNKVYVEYEEMSNFLKAMRTALGKPEHASHAEVFADLAHLVQLHRDQAQARRGVAV